MIREQSSAAALVAAVACALLTACATRAASTPTAANRSPESAPAAAYPSTYRPLPATDTLIRNATVLSGTGLRLDAADVLLVGGRIAAVGPALAAPAGAAIVDGTGKWLTPGIIDVHSHLGVYPSPGVRAHSDGNEMTAPNTAEVQAEHSVWPQDPGFAAALAGGVTTLMVLPGSANLIGGRSVTLRNVPARTVQEMKFPAAPYGLKMACGENPKRVYGEGRKTAPATRMGNMAGYRAAFIEARRYIDEQKRYERERAKKPDAAPPKPDLRSETLAGVLKGEILVHNHCYRADEMAQMLDLGHEFGFHIAAFHHAVEAYKVADLLAHEGTCAAMWADWWGFKMESFDGIRENIAMVDAAGACAIVHSDSEIGIQRLNQEAGKALAAGRRMGLALGPEHAITWLTRNPARAIGVLEQTGTLEPGKRADVVLWNRDPFSVYARAERVYLDGALVWDLADPARQPVSDFALGTTEAGGAR